MSLSELPATQKNDMVVSLAALLLEDAGESSTIPSHVTAVLYRRLQKMPHPVGTRFCQARFLHHEDCVQFNGALTSAVVGGMNVPVFSAE